MCKKAEVVAIVNIDQLTLASPIEGENDLIAEAQIIKSYKGPKEGKIKFKISRPNMSPFDISTGRNMVFLKEIEGILHGINLDRSYIHLTAPKVCWFGPDGSFKCEYSMRDVLEDVKERTK